eukprot:3932020-Rhodomonas_salina.1
MGLEEQEQTEAASTRWETLGQGADLVVYVAVAIQVDPRHDAVRFFGTQLDPDTAPDASEISPRVLRHWIC